MIMNTWLRRRNVSLESAELAQFARRTTRSPMWINIRLRPTSRNLIFDVVPPKKLSGVLELEEHRLPRPMYLLPKIPFT